MSDHINLDITVTRVIVVVGLVLCLKHSLSFLFENFFVFCTVIPIMLLVLAILKEFEQAFYVRRVEDFLNPAARAQRHPGRQGTTIQYEQRYYKQYGTQPAQDDGYKRESERLWQEEQRRVLEDIRRLLRAPQNGRDRCVLGLSDMERFAGWREDCRTLFQTPELITDMPLPPWARCPHGQCNSLSTSFGVCSHRMKNYYITSKLEEKELKEELRLWHPNGARVNQVSDGHKQEVLGMAIEIVQVLQEILEDMEKKKNKW